MKQFVFFLFFLLTVQSYGQDIVDVESYVSSNVIHKQFNLPIVRDCAGGTKLITEFEGNWPFEMKGAFEYACKIWEEAMPTSLPIRILAKLDDNRQTTAISTVSTKRVSNNGMSPYAIYAPASYTSQIKGTVYYVMSGQGYTAMYDSILTEQMMADHDIIITYYNKNNNLADNCSFSLKNETESGKYDFVSVVLRDIAKGFGLIWQANLIRNEEFRINLNTITPYEYYVLKSLGYDLNYVNNIVDPHQAYINALNDSLMLEDEHNKWYIYAPHVWDINKSLNYFMPQDDKKITRLLTYDFGRETLVRDISDKHTVAMFRDLLYWKADVPTGMSTSCYETKTRTNDVIPYKGTINLNANSSTKPHNNGFANLNSYIETDMDVNMPNLHPYYPDYHMYNGEGWTIAFLLKDGTWDIVYSCRALAGSLPEIDVNVENLILNHEIDDYARTCDGYLRCRIVGGLKVFGFSYRKYDIKYYVLDYLPQTPQASFSRILSFENEEDYYRDVRIGLNNLEGVTRVVVAQLDEDNTVPYYYEVPDFQKGYFTATVDRELTTTFTITSYNKNGSTTSTYVMPPLTPVDNLQLQFSVNDNSINVYSKGRRNSKKSLILSYQILDYSTGNIYKTGVSNCSFVNTIDTSTLEMGVYLLVVKDIKGNTHSIKFIKK